MNEVKDFIKEVIADGSYINGEELGIIENNEKVIVPKNLTLTFDGWEECTHPDECYKCELAGCCNLTSVEEVTISKMGSKKGITFSRCRGYQIGDLWTKWQRVG